MDDTQKFKYQILIVEDDKVTALFHKRKLKEQHFPLEPVLCQNGKKALEYIENSENDNTRFLVFLDLHMPVMSGWQFLHAIQGAPYFKKLKVVVVSSLTHKVDLLEALKYKQVIGFCQKPLSIQNLHEIIELKEIIPFLSNVPPNIDHRDVL